jgi:ACR3 family arsenite efflux pump ArsB
MEGDQNILSAWKTAKGVGLCLVLSLAAGWLSRELLSGKIDPANKAAACILDLTLLVMLLVLTVLGARRWRGNQLTPAAKRVLIISGVFLIVFFILGWKSDLSLR